MKKSKRLGDSEGRLIERHTAKLSSDTRITVWHYSNRQSLRSSQANMAEASMEKRRVSHVSDFGGARGRTVLGQTAAVEGVLHVAGNERHLGSLVDESEGVARARDPGAFDGKGLDREEAGGDLWNVEDALDAVGLAVSANEGVAASASDRQLGAVST